MAALVTSLLAADEATRGELAGAGQRLSYMQKSQCACMTIDHSHDRGLHLL